MKSEKLKVIRLGPTQNLVLRKNSVLWDSYCKLKTESLKYGVINKKGIILIYSISEPIEKNGICTISIKIYQLRNLKKAMQTLNKFIFINYENNQILVHILSGELFGRLILMINGFKCTLKVKKMFLINGKKYNYLLYALFKKKGCV